MAYKSYRSADELAKEQEFYIDTTDRSLVNNAIKRNFDPTGFKKNKPLQKDIYHIDPYITCSWCNKLTFVDVTTIQRMLSLPDNLSVEMGLVSEALPPCVTCGRIDCFVVGAFDFTDEINERKRKERERLNKQTVSAMLIQRQYRKYLEKMYGSALSNVFHADRYYKYRAALKITALVRGRLGRRRAATERALVVIKNSHPLLIKYSLKVGLGKIRVFWYKRQVEIDMVFKNYLELVMKTGFQPPRQIVEVNIKEISIRILRRKGELIILVQRRWRGFMAKRIVKFYRTEISRLFQGKVARAMKIQRVFRGHFARLLIPKLKYEWNQEDIMNNYLNRGSTDNITKELKHHSSLVMTAYIRERREEATCRLTSKIDSSNDHNGNKMEAFWASCYADDKLDTRISSLLETEQQLIDNKQIVVEADVDRKAYIMQRIADEGPTGFGLRGVSKTIIHQIVVDHKENQEREIEELNKQRKEEIHANELIEATKKVSIYNKPVKGQGGVKPAADTASSVHYNHNSYRHKMALIMKPFNIFYISGDQIRAKRKQLDVSGLVLADSSRSRAMRIYFETEMRAITSNFIERINNNEVVRCSAKDLLSRFKDHNKTRAIQAQAQKSRSHNALVLENNAKNLPTEPLLSIAKQRRASILKMTTNANTALVNAHTPKGNALQSSVQFDTDLHFGAQTLNALTLPQIIHAKKAKDAPKPKAKNFVFPESVGFKAMDWLFDDNAEM